MFFRKRRQSPWLGAGAGLIGGIAGSIVMGQFLHLWAKRTNSNLEEEGMQSTVKTASLVSEKVFDHQLTKEEKPQAGTAVHFGFGGSMGALYGAAAAIAPEVSTAFGVPFGVSVYLGAHAVVVPALGLSRPVAEKPVMDEAGELLGHVVYGVVAELMRRGVIAAVKAM